MPYTIKAWEDLTIQDDFMFKAVMKDKQLCKSVLEAILDRPISDIRYLTEELSLKAGYTSRGVRLDVYVEDEAHTIYDVEMQVRNEAEDALPQRLRYYQSQIDAEILAQGRDFADLRQTLVIFICPFDPFGRGWHLYWFENTCKFDADLRLEDGAIKVVLNTHGTGEGISLQLQAFMDYVNSGIISANPLVQALDERVHAVKRDEYERVSYMTYELHLRDARKAGREEGRIEGREEGLVEGETKGKAEAARSLMETLNCTKEKAMELLKIPAELQPKVLALL